MKPLDSAACRALVNSQRWAMRMTVAEDGCWLLNCAVTRAGYAQVSMSGIQVLAHRVALVAALGRDIQPDLQVGHLCHDEAYRQGLCGATAANPCRHRRCVNPDHLAEQTRRENNLASGSAAGLSARRTHCPQGHALTSENVLESRLARGTRDCRTCALDRSRILNQTIREARNALGLTHTAYCAQYGESLSVAKAIVQAAANLEVAR